MIFNQIKGNISDIDNLNNYHIEKIFINSDDTLKRILRVSSDHNNEYGITLDKSEELKDGDILLNDGKNLVVIKVKGDDVLVIKPNDITEMGIIAHSLGNRHLQAQFNDGKMIIQYDALVEEELKRDKINYSRENLKLEKAFRHVEFGHTHTHTHAHAN
ncbi:urease accessory protein UreE [Clostridium sp. NSJ-6]|uniref:Urease accessory protein UreE n=1 Tax=Clostridium hominis TaxID=2763036 RepID=A0ABR7D7U4_9CLOT|nr:urease accessory protein UreE [Clostridium hominis]MBC5627403.1 urease accessory protein UreE [Clostridium hominis]MDU2672458.1 urease accessory protein UreE [Clostridium sp.]SCK04014.1 Urease accessory protein UreE [uncultured Clostridium sp.]